MNDEPFFVISEMVTTNASETRAIEHGCASYDPTTGKLVYREDQHGGTEQ